MASNYVLKEENYRKINAELEVKTNELMKQFESLMKRQDHLNSSPTHLQRSSQENVPERSPSTIPVPPRQSFARQTQSAVQYGRRPLTAGCQETSAKGADTMSPYKVGGKGDDVLLGADKGLGMEALISFLRANVKVLQEEVQSLQTDCKIRAEEGRDHHAQLKRVEEESGKWKQLATNSKEQIKKLEHQCSVAATKQQQRETENVALRKEIESMRKELKTCTQVASSNDLRLNRCLEDNEKLKGSVKQLKLEKKELQDESRMKTNELASLVKRLERQKQELITGFKKQMQLIDNLTRQKMQLEAGRVIQCTEKEFLKLLELSENEEK